MLPARISFGRWKGEKERGEEEVEVEVSNRRNQKKKIPRSENKGASTRGVTQMKAWAQAS